MPGLNYKGTSKYQKLTEAMVKRTHFTETEIDRLADLHAKLMVKISITRYLTRSISFVNKKEGVYVCICIYICYMGFRA